MLFRLRLLFFVTWISFVCSRKQQQHQFRSPTKKTSKRKFWKFFDRTTNKVVHGPSWWSNMVVHYGGPSSWIVHDWTMNYGFVVVHELKVVLFKIKQKTSNDINIHYGYRLYYILDTISCISSYGGIWRFTYQTTMLLFWKNSIIVSIFSIPISDRNFLY